MRLLPALSLLLAACTSPVGDDLATLGVLIVKIQDTGLLLDTAGYTLQISGRDPIALPANDSVRVEGLTPGSYQVSVQGTGAKCSFGQPNPRTVTVTAGRIARTTFNIFCLPDSGVLVSVRTDGELLDPDGYLVHLTDANNQPIPTNGTIAITLPVGTYAIYLSGLAANCVVVGPPIHRVTLTEGSPLQLFFEVACAKSIAGTILVSNSAEFYGGGDWGDLSFDVLLDNKLAGTIKPNAEITLPALAGTHIVRLVAAGCFVTADGIPWNDEVSVTVPPGGQVQARFYLFCVP